MSFQNALLRGAAAIIFTVFMTVGAVGPVSAANDNANSKATSSAGATQRDDTRPSAQQGRGATAPDHSKGTAGTSGNPPEEQPESRADQNDGGANAYNCDTGTEGPYCGTERDEASGNGQGKGEATGKPYAGTVGKADNKNPGGTSESRGQMPNAKDDGNNGYECDGNQGIAKGNPAHTTCVEGADEPEIEPEPCPEGSSMNDEGECVVPPVECPEGSSMNDEGECVVPPEGGECPEGSSMNDEGECVVPPEECPEGSTMNESGECVVPPENCPEEADVSAASHCGDSPDGDSPDGDNPDGDNPVAGEDAERPSANRALVTMAATGGPASATQDTVVQGATPTADSSEAGALPATGADDYALTALAGLVLLAAGLALTQINRFQSRR